MVGVIEQYMNDVNSRHAKEHHFDAHDIEAIEVAMKLMASEGMIEIDG
jgi:hypothetical protein